MRLPITGLRERPNPPLPVPVPVPVPPTHSLPLPLPLPLPPTLSPSPPPILCLPLCMLQAGVLKSFCLEVVVQLQPPMGLPIKHVKRLEIFNIPFPID